MLAVATRPMCEPKADAAGNAHRAARAAAVPLREPRRRLQASRKPAVAAEHRHPERKRLHSRRMRQLIDEAFGEESHFALRRSAHVAGSQRDIGIDRLHPQVGN